MNLAQVLSKRARISPEKPAIVFEGETHTFGSLDAQVARYAGMLEGLGVKPGDRVAIQLSKRMEFLFLHLATLSAGGITLPLNSDYRAEELAYFLADSESSIFCTEAAGFADRRTALQGLGGIKAVLVGGGSAPGTVSLDEALDRTPAGGERAYPTAGDDVAMICYTSGTTGRSKGAMITHRNLVANMLALHRTWEWSDRDVLLHVLPLFHVHGLCVAAHGGLNAGATMIMHEKFDAQRVWKTIHDDRCTLLMAVPTVYQRLMNEWDRLEPKPDVGSMRVFISGSAPLSENQFRRFESAIGYRILERYGMTETGMNTSNRYALAGRKPGSVGYPLPGVAIRIANEEGETVTPGDVGEVQIRGDNVFRGYWRMPEKTRESFVGGWFRSGDLGYQDPKDELRLYLVGRAKELIITGGYNVYPKEVETVLESHPGVAECAVVGVPDEDFGERVTGVVVRKPEISEIPEEELIELCKAKLAGYKCPKRVYFVDSLPRNAMGKIQKHHLVDRFR